MELDGQVIVLILFVVISGIQWLFKKMKGSGQQHDISESLEDIYDDFREEIRQRQTTIQQAEPPPIPQTIPVSTSTPPTPQAVHYEEPQVTSSTRTSKPELSPEEQEAVQRFEQLTKKERRSGRSNAAISARDLLTNPQSARQAVILQEVFAKPKSLQNS